MKNNDCFYCLNHNPKGSVLAENTGWYTPCKLGINNEGLNFKQIKKCKQYEPCNGFQIGGYYTHMHFEYPEEQKETTCLEWFIHSDGEFPRDNPDEWIQFHICDFKQIEKWVKFWGKELRKKGVIK